MILQALAGYYGRLAAATDSTVAREGFETKGIPFVVVLDRKGRYKGLDDTRVPDGKKKMPRCFVVPLAVKRTSAIAANLLWDNPGYAFGRPKPNPKKDPAELRAAAGRQHDSFVKRLRDTFPGPKPDEGVAAVLAFLERGDFAALFTHPLWKEIEEAGANVTFRLDGDTELVCQRKAVVGAVALAPPGVGELTQCLVSGELDEPARLHAAIKGVWGAQMSGANIVSFNLPAFSSYGKEQGLNAPVGRKAEHAYTTALNALLARDSRQRMQVGDATAVFWAEKPHPIEGWFVDFFGLSAGTEQTQDTEAVKALFGAPKSGAPPLDRDYTRFFVLGLAPNASRLSVRFWYQGTVAEVARHIRQHFEDCRIVHRDFEPEHLPLFRLLVCTATEGKAKNIQPNLGGDLMQSILTGTPYPATLLASVVRRVRAEQSKKENGKPVQNVSYPRAALIKAVLARRARYYNRNQKEAGVSLDLANTNVGYRLGRLFAVLEKLQEEANPGLNATIRDRFYGAASSTPVTGFFVPMKLKNHHLAKLENRGRAVNLDRLIGEIVDELTDFPTHLSLEDQGRFAVGYYHQRQALFAKKTTANKED